MTHVAHRTDPRDRLPIETNVIRPVPYNIVEKLKLTTLRRFL